MFLLLFFAPVGCCPLPASSASKVDDQVMHNLLLNLQNTQRQYMAVQGAMLGDGDLMGLDGDIMGIVHEFNFSGIGYHRVPYFQRNQFVRPMEI